MDAGAASRRQSDRAPLRAALSLDIRCGKAGHPFPSPLVAANITDEWWEQPPFYFCPDLAAGRSRECTLLFARESHPRCTRRTTTSTTESRAKSSMEDSYTVHRRRKAAARKREKTPDPSSRGTVSRRDTSDDEDEERRARMERMAEEAEKVEQQQKEDKLTPPEPSPAKEPEKRDRKKDEVEKPARRRDKADARKSANADDMIAIRAEVAAKSSAAAGNSSKTRETDVAAERDNSGMRPVKQAAEATSKPDDGITKKETVKTEVVPVAREKIVQDTSETPRETNGETARPAEVRKVERRFKRKSKERAERYSRSTDSSDVDEKNESANRMRTKSPEATRLRVKKTRSRVGDPEAQKKDAERVNREKRSSSRQKLEDDTQTQDNGDKSRSKPHGQTEDTNEGPKATKKSESFPQRSAEETRAIKRSSNELKKQIIPLSNESLIEDFAKAQREYLLRERSILDPEPADVFQKTVEASSLRRRKFSLPYAESEPEETVRDEKQATDAADEKKKRSWFSWFSLPSWRRQKEDKEIAEKKVDEEEEKPKPAPKVEVAVKVEKEEAPEKTTLMDFFRALRDVVSEFKAFVAQHPHETTVIRRLCNRCLAGLLLVMIYCGLGAFVFRFVEGAFETFYKCGVKRVKRDFLDSLWNYSHNLREDDWKSMARQKLMEFEEQLHTAHEAGLRSYSGQKSWSFLNAVAYCLTVITTIGENTRTGEKVR